MSRDYPRRARPGADPIIIDPTAEVAMTMVKVITGLSRQRIHQLMDTGRFPQPIREEDWPSGKRYVWDKAAVEMWVRDRPNRTAQIVNEGLKKGSR